MIEIESKNLLRLIRQTIFVPSKEGSVKWNLNNILVEVSNGCIRFSSCDLKRIAISESECKTINEQKDTFCIAKDAIKTIYKKLFKLKTPTTIIKINRDDNKLFFDEPLSEVTSIGSTSSFPPIYEIITKTNFKYKIVMAKAYVMGLLHSVRKEKETPQSSILREEKETSQSSISLTFCVSSPDNIPVKKQKEVKALFTPKCLKEGISHFQNSFEVFFNDSESVFLFTKEGSGYQYWLMPKKKDEEKYASEK